MHSLPCYKHPLLQWYICYKYHPKSIVSIRWWYAFYGLGQTHNDMYPPLHCWHHTEWFHCPKNSLCPTDLSHLPPQPLATTDLWFYLFLESLIVGIIQYVAFLDWLLSLLICTFDSFMSPHGLIAHLFIALSYPFLKFVICEWLSFMVNQS